jgi:hypothetical protein
LWTKEALVELVLEANDLSLDIIHLKECAHAEDLRDDHVELLLWEKLCALGYFVTDPVHQISWMVGNPLYLFHHLLTEAILLLSKLNFLCRDRSLLCASSTNGGSLLFDKGLLTLLDNGCKYLVLGTNIVVQSLGVKA